VSRRSVLLAFLPDISNDMRVGDSLYNRLRRTTSYYERVDRGPLRNFEDSQASVTDNNSRSESRLLLSTARYSREIERTAAGAIVSAAFCISRTQYRRLTIYASRSTKWMIKKRVSMGNV